MINSVDPDEMWHKFELIVQQTTGQSFTGQIVATSNDICQNVCLYVQLQNPVDDIVADEY